MIRTLLHLTRRLRRQPLVTASIMAGVALAVAFGLAAALATNALAVLGLRATITALPEASQNIQLTRPIEPFDSAFRMEARDLLGNLIERDHEIRYAPLLQARRTSPLLLSGVRIRTDERFHEHVRITGRRPEPSRTAGGPSALRCEQDPPIEAIVSAEVLAGTGFRTADRLCVGDMLPVVIVGSFVPDDPTEDYWGSDLRPIRGERENDGENAGAIVVPLMIDDADFPMVASIFDASEIVHILRIETRTEQVTISNIEDVDTRLRRFRAHLNTLQPRPTVLTGLDRAIGTFNERFRLLQSALATLLLGIISLAITYLILVGTLATEQQSAEIAILRSRGGSTFQLLGHQIGQALGMLLPGAILGGGLAVLAVLLLARTAVFQRLGGGAFPWRVTLANMLLVGAILLIALAGLLLAARPALAMSLVTLRQERARPPARAGWRRLQVDGMLLLFAMLGWSGLRRYGSGLTTTLEDGQTRFNLLVLAAPILMMIGGAILFLRGFPVAVRALGQVLGRRRGIVAALGAWQLARNPLLYGRLVLLLILTVGLGVYAQVVDNTLAHEQLRTALQEAGGDVRMTIGPGTDPETLLPDDPNTAATLLTTLQAGVVRLTRDTVKQQVGTTMLLGVDGSTLANVLAQSGADDARLLANLRLLSAGTMPPLGLPLPPETRALAIRVKGTGSGFTLHAKLAGVDGVRQVAFGVPTDQWQELRAEIPAGLQAPLMLQSLVALPDRPAVGSASQSIFFGELAALPPGGKVVLSDFGNVDDWEAAGVALGKASASVAPGFDAGQNSIRLSFGALAPGRWAALRARNDAALPVLVAHEGGNLRFVPSQTLALEIDDRLLIAAVEGRTSRLPGVDDARKNVLLADRGRLTALMTYGLPTTLPPTELRLALAPGSRFTPPANATTKEAALQTQAADPLGSGVQIVLLLGFMCAIVLSVAGIVTYAALSLRARQIELAVLSALGLSSREITLLIAAEQGFVLGGGVLAGTAVGLVLALTTRPFLQIVTGSVATTPVLFDWAALLLLVAAIVAALVIALLLLLVHLRSRGLIRTLRLGEA